MAESNRTTKNKKSKISPVKAGLAGAAVVAAGAAAVTLSKKENRKKVGKAIKSIKSKGNTLRIKATKSLDNIIKKEENAHKKATATLKSAKQLSKGKKTGVKNTALTKSDTVSISPIA